MLLRPLNRVLRSFAGITSPAEKLQVARIVRAASQDCDNVIDLKALRLAKTGSAFPALPLAKEFNISGDIRAAIASFARSTSMNGGQAHSADMLYVGDLPCRQRRLDPFGILLCPALHFGAMFSGIFGALRSYSSGIMRQIFTIPSTRVGSGARHAISRSDISIVMPPTTGATGAIPEFAFRSRRNSCRMLRPLRHAAQGSFTSARRASVSQNVPFGIVALAARFAAEVKTLASRYSRIALGTSSHSFIVIQPV